MPVPDLPSLISLFHADRAELGEFTCVPSAQLPADYRLLLDHTNHMTVTMEQFYNCSVDVRVWNRMKTASHYSREIVLTRQTDNVVVQYGIPRLNLQMVEEAVRLEIESEQIPLGRVLIEHNVLREVELTDLWEVQPGPSLMRYFGMEQSIKTYGRTALIRLNGEPAVELLEIAAPLEFTLRKESTHG